MKNESFLFDLTGIGFALLDSSGNISLSNSIFKTYSRSTSTLLSECFPETFGLERVLEQLESGQKSVFYLENINRKGSDGKIVYLSLSLHRHPYINSTIVCIIKNVSQAAILKQQITQQQNDILILRQMLNIHADQAKNRLLGNSTQMHSLRESAQRVAQIPSVNILLTGESGTGKNLLARYIHFSSQNPNQAFIEINCAAIPDHLLESELFGYEKGAFTNATTSKKGLLEEANQGTLFLDEIGELPLALQAKLLHVLDGKGFRRLGSNKEVQVQFRLIAATNKDLQALVSEKKFREDLLFRLNVVHFELPPLRELDNDVLEIAEHLLHHFNIKFNKKVKGFSDKAKQAILAHHWPGNVRELSNIIERAMIFVSSDVIQEEDLLFQQHRKDENKKWHIPQDGLNLENLEKELIEEALKKTNGNKTGAAKLLGLTRDTLRYRLEKHNL